MSFEENITVLIAEDNDVTRQMMVSILKTRGYNTLEAADGSEAIDLVRRERVDLALVDLNMEPRGGFDFVKFLRSENINMPVVIITGDKSSDLLVEASSLGVPKVLQKPVPPDRLLSTVEQIVRRYDMSNSNVVETVKVDRLSPEDIMRKVIQLAENNVKTGKGRPFGAIVTDKHGHILGQGVNGRRSRCDPTAHAEVMAIRQAAETLNSDDLSGCILYVSSEPTMMGKALIISVGIKEVYYGLTHLDVQEMRDMEGEVREELGHGEDTKARYRQLCAIEVQDMLQRIVSEAIS